MCRDMIISGEKSTACRSWSGKEPPPATEAEKKAGERLHSYPLEKRIGAICQPAGRLREDFRRQSGGHWLKVLRPFLESSLEIVRTFA